MADHSRNERKFTSRVLKTTVESQQYFAEKHANRDTPRKCKFRMFQNGVDECAWCRRPRSEHT